VPAQIHDPTVCVRLSATSRIRSVAASVKRFDAKRLNDRPHAVFTAKLQDSFSEYRAEQQKAARLWLSLTFANLLALSILDAFFSRNRREHELAGFCR
jgi:hypothetical protein